ncbi:sialidase family protein [Fundicoccus culcitae]|uniref:exo-alpha-sialidase n=1 Tax=Fundicoccus culcitae TaxID=2969821 RepID=A0ABY5P957_9LACT|nr:sialidase family protein [Fundicoccus culcitae]UUX35282.1 glycoside hydrolase [Fundicoccus culcitae]
MINKLTQATMVFESRLIDDASTDQVASYRIPSLLKTKKGTLIAGIDQRHDHHFDWGNIDMVVRRSEDNGDTWGDNITIVDLATNPHAEHPDFGTPVNIDMTLIQDPTTERIFSIFGMYPEIRGLFGMLEDNRDLVEQGKEPLDEKQFVDGYLALYKEGEAYTAREGGQVFTPQGEATDYRVVLESTQAPYSDLGDLYENDTKIGNVFFVTHSASPFRIAKSMYLWESHSDDEGKTWSCPKDITTQVKADWMKFYGIGPGVSLTLHTGPHKGRLIAPTYSTNHPYILDGSQSSRVIYSDDHGVSWQSGEAVNDDRTLADGTRIHSATMDDREEQNTEAVAVQLNSGTVMLFMRNLSGSVQSAVSLDGGATWEEGITTHEGVNDVYCQLSAVQTVQDGQEYVLLVNADGPKRTNGVVRVAKVNADDTLTWVAKKPLQEGKFAYSAIQQIGDDAFGVLYEHADEAHNEYCILFKRFDWAYLVEE